MSGIQTAIMQAEGLLAALRTHAAEHGGAPPPGPAPAPEPPGPVPKPAPGVPMTLDQRHFANFVALYDEGPDGPTLAYLYAHLGAVPAGWFSRAEGLIIKKLGSKRKRDEWARDVRTQSLSSDEFLRLLGMAQLANLG